MLSLVNGFTNANTTTICIIAVLWGKKREKKTTCQISDGLSSCFVKQEMITSIQCSTKTYNLLAFLPDPHNSKQKALQSCLRLGKLNILTFHSH